MVRRSADLATNQGRSSSPTLPLPLHRGGGVEGRAMRQRGRPSTSTTKSQQENENGVPF